MSKHTPGPWRLDSPYEDGRFCVIADSVEQTICDTLNDTQDSDEQHLANARLIAVAPEMLEALKRIADMKDRDGNEIEMHIKELRAIARSAIAKAEGRE